MDLVPVVSILARWVHFLAGIMWIGLLYYFNFVQTPSMPREEEIAESVRRVLHEPYVLFVGRIENRKNIGHVVDAVLPLGNVRLVGGIPTAEVELRTSNGDVVPIVTVGDKLQARQSAVAPFKTSPGCGSPLLISGKFQ